MKNIIIYFVLGFIIIGAVSIFLPQIAMNIGDHGITITVVAFTILVLLVTFGVKKLVRSDMKADHLPNGIPAIATVISCQQGNYKVSFGGVQEVFQLIIDVTVENKEGETWPANIKAMIPLTQIAVFLPGVRFAVKYDPNNKKKVVIDQNPVTQPSEVNIPGYGTMSQQNIQSAKQNAPKDITLGLEASSSLLEELQNSGVSATATVLSKDILYANYLPYIDAVQLKVQIHATDRTSFERIVEALLGKDAQYKAEIGKTVYVKYDRNNSQRVCLSGTDQPNTAQKL